MDFSEFANKLYSVLSGGDNVATFTRTLFDSLVKEEGKSYLEDRSDSAYKSYYYGKSQITKLAKSINTYIDRVEFLTFLDEYDDSVIENLCSEFIDYFPDVTTYDIKDKLADCFVEIVTNAAKSTKKTSHINEKQKIMFPVEEGISPDEIIKRGNKFTKYLLESSTINNWLLLSTFDGYLKKAKADCSNKKTLLYADRTRPFYDMYVCNDVVRHSRRSHNNLPEEMSIISNASILDFEPVYTHVIIQGTGGIGKSMFLTHLFLSFDRNKDTSHRVPILIQLRDYSSERMTITDLIIYTVKKYNSSIDKNIICDAISNGGIILLLDGLDEIPSSCRRSFNEELDIFVKLHMDITIIMTSRPISSFVSYAHFALYDIRELTQEQAIQLVKKIDFWDPDSKKKFINDLKIRLYRTHRQFASNPLLLTIMLMTYSSYGDVPAKMHHFYSEAYKTMSRYHDATKGSYVRPLITGITPEEFSELFAEFCARTYVDECVDFEERSFTEYMKAVLKRSSHPYCDIKPHDFLTDLTDNLCLLYQEGEKYYFIHRSFQEYFAALYFSVDCDAHIENLGVFFEEKRIRFNADIALDMLFDMAKGRVEQFIFLPYLKRLFLDDSKDDIDEYWGVVEKVYQTIFCEEGEPEESFNNEPQSFLYERIIELENLTTTTNSLDSYSWPSEINDWRTAKIWCSVYSDCLDWQIVEMHLEDGEIPDYLLNKTSIVDIEDVPSEYYEFIGNPSIVGVSVEIDIKELREKSEIFTNIISAMESPSFPLMIEYHRLKEFYIELKEKYQQKPTNPLFDD